MKNDASTCYRSSMCYGSTFLTQPSATAHQPQLSNQMKSENLQIGQRGLRSLRGGKGNIL